MNHVPFFSVQLNARGRELRETQEELQVERRDGEERRKVSGEERRRLEDALQQEARRLSRANGELQRTAERNARLLAEVCYCVSFVGVRGWGGSSKPSH